MHFVFDHPHHRPDFDLFTDREAKVEKGVREGVLNVFKLRKCTIAYYFLLSVSIQTSLFWIFSFFGLLHSSFFVGCFF